MEFSKGSEKEKAFSQDRKRGKVNIDIITSHLHQLITQAQATLPARRSRTRKCSIKEQKKKENKLSSKVAERKWRRDSKV